MRILVNHLTRMQKGYICVAGIDANLNHVRPVLVGRLSTRLLAQNGGLFDIACVVELRQTTYVGRPPELEDHRFNPHEASRLRVVKPDRFWGLLSRVAMPRLTEIFGPELTQRGSGSCGVDVGQGRASLGCLISANPPILYLRPQSGKPDQVRMSLHDGEFDLDLSVTDIRLYKRDHVTPDARAVSLVARRLKSGVKSILSVGLTRPFSSSSDFAPVHWLQINNIHLEDDPTWQLG